MKKIIEETLSYDDVFLIPAYADFLPHQADVKTRLVGDIHLNVPIMSAAMDTVTEDDMAIALALEGGVGVIHRNLSPEMQAEQVGNVKRFLNWIIENPISVHKGTTIADVKHITAKYGISGLPVVEDDNTLVGIITERDLRFCTTDEVKVEDIMTKNPHVVSDEPTMEIAQQKFDQYKIEKLPVVDKTGKLTGLITFKDIEKHQNFPNCATDTHGRLLVGAAISPNDLEQRIPLLIKNKVDFVVLDTAHGDSIGVIEAIKTIKRDYNVPVIGGNVVTKEGAQRLIDAGTDAIKVGVGPGSICTTRVVAGIGMAQFSAIMAVAEVAQKHDIPVIADGGIKFSGDITKAVCAGASSVMLGNLLAGLKESPGREIIYDGRMFKEYRGMGSMGAIKDGSGDRYQMKKGDSPVPEGIEGRVPYKGELQSFIHQMVTGLRKGMGYVGCRSIKELNSYPNIGRVTGAGLRESHAHDVTITQEAPNYSRK